MRIKIEKFLKSHRETLDVEQPDEQLLWEGIRKELIKDKNTSYINFWKIAAIALLIIGGVYISVTEINRKNNYTLNLAHFSDILGEKENEYKLLVEKKKEELNISSDTENEIIQSLFEELNYLDTIYNECINDLEESGYLEQIVNTIFDTYEKRIDILEQIIHETNKEKMYENKKNKILL
jgi:hypothetical protein